MTLPGLVAANNLTDVVDREKAWDNLGLNIEYPTETGGFEYETIIYLAKVENIDGQALEFPVKLAINNFVLGCKVDGIWNAIKSSCILAGARTLNGALVPLVGVAPSNNNFVTGDYNRKTGLVGNGSTKYLNSNRASNADPQNSNSLSIYVTNLGAATSFYCGTGNSVSSATSFGVDPTGLFFRNRSFSFGRPSPVAGSHSTGLIGMSRNTSSEFVVRANKNNTTLSIASNPPDSSAHLIYAANGDAFSGSLISSGRLAFYSIGEFLDLSLLDNRVTTLINDIGAAIP